jgi:hypothetical protein
MKSFLLILTFLSAAVFSQTYSTNFDGTENPISESGAWHHTGTHWQKAQKTGGIAFGTQTGSGGYDDSYAYLSGFPANQSATAVIQRTDGMGGNHEAEVLLRWRDTPDSAKGYECLIPYDGQYPPHIVRWNGAFGDYTILLRGSISVLAKTGDVVSASINGNLIIVTFNGSEILRATDNTYSAGNPGMGFYRETGGTNSDMAFTSYSATALGTEIDAPRLSEPFGRPQLCQNQPNPFNMGTTIVYKLPSLGMVTLRVYDMLGREMTTLVNQKQPAGSYSVRFDGSSLPPGAFTAKLRSGNSVETRKMLLVK